MGFKFSFELIFENQRTEYIFFLDVFVYLAIVGGLLAEGEQTVVDEVCQGVDDVAKDSGNAVAGENEAGNAEVERAEGAVVEHPHNPQLQAVAQYEAVDEADSFAHHLPVAVEHPLAVAQEGIYDAADVADGVANVRVQTQEGFAQVDDAERNQGIEHTHHAVFDELEYLPVSKFFNHLVSL